MASHASMEVAKTVLEVADMAWTALEVCHHHHPHEQGTTLLKPAVEMGGNEIEFLRSENRRLRELLEKNLNLIEQISSSLNFVENCPSDLHERVLTAVNSESFTNELDYYRGEYVSKFPFDDPSALMKALGGENKLEKMLNIWHAGKIFYTLGTWGLVLASVYQGRAILKLATLGVHHSTKLALKAL